jgi:hypothetical protein
MRSDDNNLAMLKLSLVLYGSIVVVTAALNLRTGDSYWNELAVSLVAVSTAFFGRGQVVSRFHIAIAAGSGLLVILAMIASFAPHGANTSDYSRWIWVWMLVVAVASIAECLFVQIEISQREELVALRAQRK